jgi:hypothetical protein
VVVVSQGGKSARVPTVSAQIGNTAFQVPRPVRGSIVKSWSPVEAHSWRVRGSHSSPTDPKGTMVGWKPPRVPVFGSSQKIWAPAASANQTFSSVLLGKLWKLAERSSVR